MKARTRTEAIQTHFTPLQMVLLDVEEARRLGSFEAYARSLASGDLRPKRVDILAEMARSRFRGHGGKLAAQQLREVQREAMFLNRLAVETWSSISANMRAWKLTAAVVGLLHSMVLEMIFGERTSVDEVNTVIEVWHDAARSHRDEVLTEVEAAHLIEREYFRGAKIMFDRDEETLVRMISSVEHQLRLAARAKSVCDRGQDEDGVSPDDRNQDSTRQDAVDLANDRADLARAHVHDRFSEDREVATLLRSILRPM